MREDVHATRQFCIVNDGLINAMPFEHAGDAASVHNTCLDKIACYLQRIFNRKWKLKQQVSKWVKYIKIGCVFKNQCMLHFRLHFFQMCQNLNF